MFREIATCLLITSLTLSCSDVKRIQEHRSTIRPDLAERLDSRSVHYCNLSRKHYEQTSGNLMHCDSALFTAIHGLQCGYVSIGEFMDDRGKLFRTTTKSCLKDKKSKSEFSRDMALGLQLYLSANPDKKMAEKVVEYGKANKWVVCDAESLKWKIGRCTMTPKIINNWYKLAGKEAPWFIPNRNINTLKTGYQAHLQIISILVGESLDGKLSKVEANIASRQADREPYNHLFRAVDIYINGGDPNPVAESLLERFPYNRLPNTHDDQCTPYLYQRDYTSTNAGGFRNWQPCKSLNYTEHTGTDYLLAAYLLKRANR